MARIFILFIVCSYHIYGTYISKILLGLRHRRIDSFTSHSFFLSTLLWESCLEKHHQVFPYTSTTVIISSRNYIPPLVVAMKSTLSLLLLASAASTSAFAPGIGGRQQAAASSTSLSMAGLTLYGSQGSRSPLVNWGASEVGLDLTMGNLATNPHPFGQIPCLTDDNDVLVFESGAILQYLYSKASETNGDSDSRKASITSWISCKWFLFAYRWHASKNYLFGSSLKIYCESTHQNIFFWFLSLLLYAASILHLIQYFFLFCTKGQMRVSTQFASLKHPKEKCTYSNMKLIDWWCLYQFLSCRFYFCDNSQKEYIFYLFTISHCTQHRYDTGLKKPNKRIDVLDKLLSKQEFLVEGGFSLADVAVASYLLYVPQFFQGTDLSRWPHVVRYMRQCAGREAYGKAFGPNVQSYLVAACDGMMAGADYDKKKLFGLFWGNKRLYELNRIKWNGNSFYHIQHYNMFPLFFFSDSFDKKWKIMMYKIICTLMMYDTYDILRKNRCHKRIRGKEPEWVRFSGTRGKNDLISKPYFWSFAISTRMSVKLNCCYWRQGGK